LKKITIRLAATAIAAAALGLALAAAQVSAASGSLSITNGSAAVGNTTSVDLWAGDITEPGLGAWSIDIKYDPDVVTALSCQNGADQIAVCNPAFADDEVRVSGANANGLTGDVDLASITFRCHSAGDSPLTITPKDFMDATPGDLQPIDVTLVHGKITCGAVLPATGSGPEGATSFAALIAMLAVLGLALAGGGALLRRSA
jgi:hypothetical protein